MRQPLLPAFDLAGVLRETAFALILRDRQPVAIDGLASAVGASVPVVRAVVDALVAAGWMDRGEDGLVTGAAGLSLSTGPHRLVVGGTPFQTWCAYDALGIPAALAVDAGVETTCGVCGIPISVKLVAGRPVPGAELLWLASGEEDLRGSFCTPTVLLCGRKHGSRWADSRGGRGELLDLAEGARVGADAWAGCAATFKRLT